MRRRAHRAPDHQGYLLYRYYAYIHPHEPAYSHYCERSGSSMRVGINATFLGTRAAGVETYVRNIIRSLAAPDPKTEYILYTHSSLPDSLIPSTKRMRRVLVPSHRDGSPVPLTFSPA